MYVRHMFFPKSDFVRLSNLGVGFTSCLDGLFRFTIQNQINESFCPDQFFEIFLKSTPSEKSLEGIFFHPN